MRGYWGFAKIRSTFVGIPATRIIVFWGPILRLFNEGAHIKSECLLHHYDADSLCLDLH